jgi:hypothetical protein
MDIADNKNKQQWADAPGLGYSMLTALKERGTTFNKPPVAGTRSFGDKQVLGNLSEKCTFNGMQGFSGMLDTLPTFRFSDPSEHGSIDLGDNQAICVGNRMVGFVKPGFNLVQHSELMAGLADAFQEWGINPVGHHATTPEGSLKGWAFIGKKGDNARLGELPDGHALTLRFRNGGDGKTGMVLQLGSKILVCTNDNVWVELEMGLSTNHRNGNWQEKASKVASALIEKAPLIAGLEADAKATPIDALSARYAITAAIGTRALSPLWNGEKPYYVRSLSDLERSIQDGAHPNMNVWQAYNAGTALTSHLLPTTDLSALDGPLNNLGRLLKAGRNLSVGIEKGREMVEAYTEKLNKE